MILPEVVMLPTHLLSLLLACGAPADRAVSPGEAEARADQARPTSESDRSRVKGGGGVVGASNYCDGAILCAVGEGDCDLDSQCEAGLVCAKKGSNWGLPWQIDVCVAPHCENGIQDADETAIDFGGADCGDTCAGANGDVNGYCQPGCECLLGEGDCDLDTDCDVGLECGEKNGTQWGFDDWKTQTCVPAHCSNLLLDADETAIDFGGADCGDQCGGENGDLFGFCSFGCPCAEGQGACTYDEQCQGDLRCTGEQGARFGMHPFSDVCLPLLTVDTIQPGQLLITEIMKDPTAVPDAVGEWFEVFNRSGHWVDLQGMVFSDDDIDSFTVVGPLEVRPNGHLVFARQDNPNANGGIVADYDWPGIWALANAADEIVLSANGVEIHRVMYDDGILWPDTPGASIQLEQDGNPYPFIYADDTDVANWCHARAELDSGDFATPGLYNWGCP